VRRHLAELERRTERARTTVPELLALLRDEEDPMPYEITVREVGAQPIVSITRKLKVAGPATSSSRGRPPSHRRSSAAVEPVSPSLPFRASLAGFFAGAPDTTL
jgi:hypothetical protein